MKLPIKSPDYLLSAILFFLCAAVLILHLDTTRIRARIFTLEEAQRLARESLVAQAALIKEQNAALAAVHDNELRIVGLLRDFAELLGDQQNHMKTVETVLSKLVLNSPTQKVRLQPGIPGLDMFFPVQIETALGKNP